MVLAAHHHAEGLLYQLADAAAAADPRRSSEQVLARAHMHARPPQATGEEGRWPSRGFITDGIIL